MRTKKEGNNVLALTYFPMKIVSSALKGLTTVFGMGTGVTPSLEAPEHYYPQQVNSA